MFIFLKNILPKFYHRAVRVRPYIYRRFLKPLPFRGTRVVELHNLYSYLSLYLILYIILTIFHRWGRGRFSYTFLCQLPPPSQENTRWQNDVIYWEYESYNDLSGRPWQIQCPPFGVGGGLGDQLKIIIIWSDVYILENSFSRFYLTDSEIRINSPPPSFTITRGWISKKLSLYLVFIFWFFVFYKFYHWDGDRC